MVVAVVVVVVAVVVVVVAVVVVGVGVGTVQRQQHVMSRGRKLLQAKTGQVLYTTY